MRPNGTARKGRLAVCHRGAPDRADLPRANGQRMDRYAADRTVKRLTRRVGITKRISPHSLRHSFITAALDARVPRRNVQEAASHADPRTSMRYDRARQSLDRHATYTVVRQNDERRAPSGRYVVAARPIRWPHRPYYSGRTSSSMAV